ncbi:hypothetical protein QBC34DRAFT_415292 [Podospora aff. communis PSN243]|uniref:Pre-mRNA splicing factor n=1 Tax=Podospora aff. communis PSN243 TaxID=3040156 RepID=A0AAV9G7B1_9PEZI|nr:hypothetical protein QBC34DRAFT_415292 [Podospora aff. communis PSN243]
MVQVLYIPRDGLFVWYGFSIMTRKIVYSATLVALVAATAMTIASIVTPKWISYTDVTKAGNAVYDNIGLHRRCMSTHPDGCVPFPDEAGCETNSHFCSLWKTTGFLMSLAVVVDLATIVGFLVIVAGGKEKRETGWRVLCGMLGLIAALEFGAVAVAGYVFDHDNLFHVPGYALGASWYLCTGSGAVAALCAVGLVISAVVLPPEGGYVFLRDTSGV